MKTQGLEIRLAATKIPPSIPCGVGILLYKIKRELLIFRIFRFLGLILAFSSLYACSEKEISSKDSSTVYVEETRDGYNLIRNGEDFVIRGVAGHEQLHRLHQMGGNTIRVYDTTDLGQILDSAHANDIAVIVGLWMMGNLEMDYSDSFLVDQQYEEIRESVRRYRDHPALLMWCLGNEISYRASLHELFFPSKMWLAFEDLVDLIHKEDPNHPVTTTITNYQRKRLLYFKFRVPQLDIVGINTFGRLAELRSMFKWYNWFFDMPFFLAEWAISGPWESATTDWYTPIESSSSEKATDYVNFYREFIPHEDPRFLGSCVFYWGYKQEHTHSWFSLFTEKGEPTLALEALEQVWTGTLPTNFIPVADSLVVNGASSEDGIILNPGQIVNAHLFAHDKEGDELKTEWEILPDSWHFDYRAINQKPKPIEDLIQVKASRDIRFNAPYQEGTYRLFAKVSDAKSGGASMINTTFLVVR